MKRKRLDRDGWGLQGFPYYQMRVDLPEFCGTACLLRILDGKDCCWQMPKAGRTPVVGAGMTWLQLIPDGQHRVITVKYRRGKAILRGRQKAGRLPVGPVAVWYVDVIDRVEAEPDGVLAFIDLYLDVIFTPQGDLHVDDREELDAALAAGDVTPEQHRMAIAEGESILRDMCADVHLTEQWCGCILRHVLSRLDDGDVLRRNVI